jgi:membrane-bound metal-dependent hydrolase YbcI (DUF457 family)
MMKKMTAHGHYLTALSLGIVGAATILDPVYGKNVTLAFGDIIHWSADVIKNGIEEAPICSIALMFLFGCAIGAWAPDWLEGVLFINGYRHSFIPHRTLTHTVALWVILLIVAYGCLSYTEDPWQVLLSWFFIGFTSAGLLHVFIDMLSPTGVPLLMPFRTRLAFTVYKTGRISEYKVIVPVVGASIGYVMFLW